MKPLLPSKKRRRTDLEPTLTAVERQMCENFALDNDIVAGVHRTHQIRENRI
jgi:hypothetical protein